MQRDAGPSFYQREMRIPLPAQSTHQFVVREADRFAHSGIIGNGCFIQ
jgi:hypothetical protein